MQTEPPRYGTATIELASGRYLDLKDPDPETIIIGDIAHHLAQCNRYAGACSRPLSVAEHAVLVSQWLEVNGESWEVCLAGLHHDDAEAFCGDVTRPLKEEIGPLYNPIEDRVWQAIAIALELDSYGIDTQFHDPMVKDADLWSLSKEAYHLCADKGVGWPHADKYDPTDPFHNTSQLHISLREVSFFTARDMYKGRHRHLMRRIEGRRRY